MHRVSREGGRQDHPGETPGGLGEIPQTLTRRSATARPAEVEEGHIRLTGAGLMSIRRIDFFAFGWHLKVFVAQPAYLFAMKCAALRLGEEFHDLDDVRFLLRYLGLSTVEEALAIVTRYFEEKHLQPKTRLVLEELLGGASG